MSHKVVCLVFVIVFWVLVFSGVAMRVFRRAILEETEEGRSILEKEMQEQTRQTFYHKAIRVKEAKPRACPNGIDVVWVWTNISDPTFLVKAHKMYPDQVSRMSRMDLGLLKYSMRSVLEHAPYIKRWWVVVDHTTPTFLSSDTQTYQGFTLHVVQLDTLLDPNTLPTFNPLAILSVLHTIPGLSNCFIPLTQDVLLAHDISLEYLFKDETIIKTYYSHPSVPTPAVLSATPEQLAMHTTGLLLSAHLNDGTFTPRREITRNFIVWTADAMRKAVALWPEQVAETRTAPFVRANHLHPRTAQAYLSIANGTAMIMRETQAVSSYLVDDAEENVWQINYLLETNPCVFSLTDEINPTSYSVYRQTIRHLDLACGRRYRTPTFFERLN